MGVSAGDNLNYTLVAGYDGEATLCRRHSVELQRVDSPHFAESPAGGFGVFNPPGAAKGWHDSWLWRTYTLPWSFPFYDKTYSSLYVTSGGFLEFGSSGSLVENSLQELLRYSRIAPLWDDFRLAGPGDDVFIDTSVADQVSIRWDATGATTGDDVNFAVTLYQTGEMRFEYGPGNDGLTPTVGVSRGDGQSATLSQYDGQADVAGVPPVQFALTPGVTYADIGAYEFRGSSDDDLPPQVVSTTPALIGAGGSSDALVTEIALEFSEELLTMDANSPASYELRRAVNGVFDDADDVVYRLEPNYGFTAATGQSRTVLGLGLGGTPLPLGDYRLTVRSTVASALHDTAGLRLDGDADGDEGPGYVRAFTVLPHNQAPVAEADGPYWIDVGQDLVLDGTGSSDPDAGCGDSLVMYEWDLNADGSYEFTGAAPTVPWSALSGLPQPGLPIPVRLRVTDTFGVTDTDDTELRIYVNAPVAAFTATPNPCACDQTVSFDAGASSPGWPDRQIVSYEWDFDYQPGVFDIGRHGATAIHAYPTFGSRTVALRVTDNNTPPKTDTVTVVGRGQPREPAPVAEADGPYWIDVGQDLALDGTGSSDPDAGCGDSLVKYEWDLNGGWQLRVQRARRRPCRGRPCRPAAAGPADPRPAPRDRYVRSHGHRRSRNCGSTSTRRWPPSRPRPIRVPVPRPSASTPAPRRHGRPDRQIVSYEWDFDYQPGMFDFGRRQGRRRRTLIRTFGSRTVALRVTDNNTPPKTDT